MELRNKQAPAPAGGRSIAELRTAELAAAREAIRPSIELILQALAQLESAAERVKAGDLPAVDVLYTVTFARTSLVVALNGIGAPEVAEQYAQLQRRLHPVRRHLLRLADNG